MKSPLKKLLPFIFLSFLMMNCSELINKPKNLIAKDKMSMLVAEFALNDQINNFIPGTDLETATRTVLKNNNIKAKDFNESYKFYAATGDLDKILSDAQEIILDKDPAAKKFIEKNLQNDLNNLPTVK